MEGQVTLILILHNRHNNLERLIEFYREFTSPIIIADSSTNRHIFQSTLKSSVKYLYMPGITYTEKIEKTLDSVHTPYVALCADDDFIIPTGLYDCVEFLNRNKDYSCAQGMILKYYKNTISYKLRFDILYRQDHSLTGNVSERVNGLFSPYSSLLYAVHRLSILKNAFSGAGVSFKNLYLNEYLVSIFSVVMGKYKNLASLYQVREHAEISDDKITPNIDVILTDEKYRQEYANFLNHILDRSVGLTEMPRDYLREIVVNSLNSYCLYLESLKKLSIPFKKRIGALVEAVPIIGKKYIMDRRYNKSHQSLQKHLKNEDYLILAEIATLTKNYSRTG